MDKTVSSGSCDTCHTYIWLFPVRLMFLLMVSALAIHLAKTSAQQLFPLHANPPKTVIMGVQGTLTPFDSGKSQDRVMKPLDLLRL